MQGREDSEEGDRLRRIESLAQPGLGHLDVDDLLIELLTRIRDVLAVDQVTALVVEALEQQLVPVASVGLEEAVRQGVLTPVGRGFVGRIAAEARPRVLSELDRGEVVNPVLWQAGIRSMLGVPMLSAGAVTGVLHVGTLTPRTFTDEDTSLLEMAAERVALATQARVSRSERDAAVALQRSLLPAALPEVPGLELAARYLPGAAGVGGDWYDVFPLPSGWLGVVIGDVVGRGLRAAVVMGRLRSALRAYALEFDDPADVLARLDRKAQYFEVGIMATALFAQIDPTRERVRLSSAGHPPPVLATPATGAREIALPDDLALGVRLGLPRHTVELELAPGASLCLYTDGLVERRDRPLEVGVAQLCASISSCPAESVCSDIVAKLVGADTTDDDIAVMVVRRIP